MYGKFRTILSEKMLTVCFSTFLKAYLLFTVVLGRLKGITTHQLQNIIIRYLLSWVAICHYLMPGLQGTAGISHTIPEHHTCHNTWWVLQTQGAFTKCDEKLMMSWNLTKKTEVYLIIGNIFIGILAAKSDSYKPTSASLTIIDVPFQSQLFR